MIMILLPYLIFSYEMRHFKKTEIFSTNFYVLQFFFRSMGSEPDFFDIIATP